MRLSILLVLVAPFLAVANDDYLSELTARSQALHLHERREWNRLLHYTKNLILPGVHGLADAPRFYLAADGKTNPQAELEATLASFFSGIQETDEVQNPQCQFIARFAWLDEQLHFDPARMPRQPCKRFHAWHDALNPGGVTLIFPAAYINNPSSMYGHTLLRIDGKDQNEKTRLLAYAINYAANTNETNGIAFAVNGLFGGYPGAFSIMPYYLKVREYNDLENRDIWVKVLEEHGVTIEAFKNFVLFENPNIVHYGGHGSTNGVVLEDRELSASILSGIFQLSDQTQCVLLNACRTLETAKILAQHIPYVIGTQDVINDRTAVAFARGFYMGLVANKTIEEAFKSGLLTVKMESLPDADVLVLVKGE